MDSSVGLYDSAYANYEADVYRKVRIATYDYDLGQTSWATSEESREIPQLLRIAPSFHVLEVGCGSGRYALQVAAETRCRIVGLDVNRSGIEAANHLAQECGLADRSTFQHCDVSEGILFPNEAFDAAFANDVFCHLPRRVELLRDLHRVLKPNGRLLFSDALVIGGVISHEEIARRSSIGFYVFSPPGHNEELIRSAGFTVVETRDTTDQAAAVAGRWHDARNSEADILIKIEGQSTFEGIQRFLFCVRTLCEERRLLRLLYVAEKS